MFYKKYLVREADHFDPDNFPGVAEDLETIEMTMKASPALLSTETLLAFVKGQKQIGIESNPALANMVQSGSLPLQNLEALFDSCGENKKFSEQLENYIKTRCNK